MKLSSVINVFASSTALCILLAGCGVTAPTQSTSSSKLSISKDSSGPPNMAAAKKETLVIWDGEIQASMNKFLQDFTNKTGIKTAEVHLLPGAVMPKLNAEFQQGNVDVDIWMSSDAGLLYGLQKQGHLLQYESPELKNYEPQYKSNPEGYWAAYMINSGPMMYNPKYLNPKDAPKTWSDLLNPKWKGQIGFQDASAGTQYAWWYLLKDKLPSDYFTNLAKNQPKAYSSSTQMLRDLLNGDLKIGGKVSIQQYAQAASEGVKLNVIAPPEGVPSNLQALTIFANAPHPDAAKVFEDFLLSQEGQELWNNVVQKSYSPLASVKTDGLPDKSTMNILLPNNLADYAASSNHKQFVNLWNSVVGLH